jgi:hypothetical protein
MRRKQVAVWIADEALMATVRGRAEAEGLTVTRVVQELLRGWVGRSAVERAGPPPMKAAPGVTAPTGPMAAPSVCRRCGHEARKHEPSCIMMGCPCRKFV